MSDSRLSLRERTKRTLLSRSERRLWCLLLFVCFTSCAFAARNAHADKTEETIDRPMLYWRNGDVLPGEIHAGTTEILQWQADPFLDPLQVRFDHLQMVRFPVNSDALATSSEEPNQIIETHDGNRFFGKITGSTAGELSIDTELFGLIQLKRSAIHLIANPAERAHVYSGPKGLRGWSTLTYGRKLSEWEEIASGRLHTRMVAAELYRSLPAKGSVDLDVELLWRNNPSFQIRFLTPYVTPTKETIKVETRVGGFVVQTLGSNGRFRLLDTIPKSATKCRLLLRWNHNTGDLSIYRNRKYLGKINVASGKGSGNAGFYLKNTGPQLTLARLEVRASSSLDIRYADPTKDTILLSSNQTIAGNVKHITAEGIELATKHSSDEESDKVDEPEGDTKTDVETKTEPQRIPWSDITEIALHGSKPEQSGNAEVVECVFHNGETLKGKLLTADAVEMSLKVPAIQRPIEVPLEALERISIGPPTVPAKSGQPHILMANRKLHGSLRAAENKLIGWQCVGGVAASKLNPDADVKVYLGQVNSSSAGGPQDDLLYLQNGDVFPCRLQRAVPGRLEIRSDLSSTESIPSKQIHAVELSVEAVAPLEGFDDRWQLKKPEEEKRETADVVTRRDDQIHFKAAGSASRKSILYGCDQISFDLKKRIAEGGVFLHFVLKGEEEKEDRAIPFYFMDEKLFVLGSKRNAFIPCTDEEGLYKVVIETHDPFKVMVNSKVVYTIPRNENGGPWSGLSFDLSDGPLFGPPLRRKKKEIDIAIRNLKIRQTKRASIRQSTGSIDSSPLLIVPRNREAEGLTHMAVGNNSDVIRGTLTELSGDYLRMTSKGTQIQLPRETLSGLIWLNSKSPDQMPLADENVARLVLKDTTTLTLSELTITDGKLAGTHASLGQCSVPIADVQSILTGEQENNFHQHDFLSWKLTPAREPEFATEGSLGHRMESPLVGKSIEFEAELLGTRERLDLSSYRGRILVLDFWATWCAPCMRNMPQLMDTVGQFPKSQVALVAVNEGEDPSTVMSVVESKQWDLTVATDLEGTATQQLRIEALPQTVVVDQEGKVASVFVGASRRLHVELKQEIEKLLGEER